MKKVRCGILRFCQPVGWACLATLLAWCTACSPSPVAEAPASASDTVNATETLVPHPPLDAPTARAASEPETSESEASQPDAPTDTEASADTLVDQTAVIATARSREMQDSMERDIDPSSTPWNTEVFAEQATAQLKHVGEFLVDAASPGGDHDVDFLADEFACTPLRPAEAPETYRDPAITVHALRDAEQTPAYHGVEGWREASRELLKNFADAEGVRFKFKLFRVQEKTDSVDTTSLFEISGATPQGAVQVNARWQCRWTRPSGEREPKLTWIGVVDYEEVQVRHEDQRLFSDFTHAVFQDLPALEQLSYGTDWWRTRIEHFMRVYWDGQNGMAVADVNGDGLDDVYFCEPGGLPNRLLVQTPGGTLDDVSAQSGVDFLDYSRSALLVDFDNDGDQDLLIPSYAQLSVFSNDGRGRFTLQANMSVDGETAYTLAAADYDEDGDVDFYACYYRGSADDETQRLPAPLPFHDARTGGRNHLFRNDGDFQFTDVTAEVGLDQNNDRWSYSAVWEDLDNDGDLDLYVANDYGRNNLYRFAAGRFEDVADEAGAEDVNFGMSASAGDYDRDGWMDLYISNMFSAAGGRVTFQPQFKADEPEALKEAYQQMARGNTLLRNLGDGRFQDVSELAGVSTGRWAWTSLFTDLNNDGWEDLIVANGFVTGKMPDDL